MQPLPMPHRVGLLTPLAQLPPSRAGLADVVARLLGTLVFEHIVGHPIVSLPEPSMLPLVAADGRPLDPTHPDLPETKRHWFVDHRRDELLWFELDLTHRGQPRGALHVERFDGDTRVYEAPEGVQLGAIVEGCLSRWLREHRFAPAPRSVPDVDDVSFLLAAQHIADILVVARDADPALLVDAPPPALPIAARRVLMWMLETPRPATILASDPHDPWALHDRLEQALRAGDDVGEASRELKRRAPQWGAVWMHTFRRAPLPDQLYDASVAATLRPADPDALTHYALTLVQARRADEAFRFADRAARIDPGHVGAQVAALQALRIIGRPGQAWHEARRRLQALEQRAADGALPDGDVQLCMARLLHASVHLDVGQLQSAVDLRLRALERCGALPNWDHHAGILEKWQTERRALGLSWARDGHHRGDPGRVLEAFARIIPERGTDLAKLIDAHFAVGQDRLALHAYAQHRTQRLGRHAEARLAGARALVMAGHLEAALEQIRIVQLRQPQALQGSRINRVLRLAAHIPAPRWEAEIRRLSGMGAHRLAATLARDAADFVPGLSAEVVDETVGPRAGGAFDPGWLEPLRQVLTELPGAEGLPERLAQVDALFAATPDVDELCAADRLVDGWLELVDPAGIAGDATLAYLFASALGRYFSRCNGPPSPIGGALRCVATDALRMLAIRRAPLDDYAIATLLWTVEQPWPAEERLWDHWLLRIERALDLEGRSGHLRVYTQPNTRLEGHLRGDLDIAFELRLARAYHSEPGLGDAARELYERCFRAVGASVAPEWCDAVRDARDTDDAIDVYWTAAASTPEAPEPMLALADALLETGRPAAALEALIDGLPLVADGERAEVAARFGSRVEAALGVPAEVEACLAQAEEKLAQDDPEAAILRYRWAAALRPEDPMVPARLGVAWASLGRVVEAADAFARADLDQGPLWSADALLESGHTEDALDAYRHASMTFEGPEAWLELAEAAFRAGAPQIAVEAFDMVDEMATGGQNAGMDAEQLAAYARSLYAVGDFEESEIVARQLIALAAGDANAGTQGWLALARAQLAMGQKGPAQRALENARTLDSAGDQAAALDDVARRIESGEPEPPSAPDPGLSDLAFRAIRDGSFRRIDLEGALPNPGQDPDLWRLAWARLVAAAVREREVDRDRPVPEAAVREVGRVLAATAGSTDPEALLCRLMALRLREEHAHPVDPPPGLGDDPGRGRFRSAWRTRQ